MIVAIVVVALLILMILLIWYSIRELTNKNIQSGQNDVVVVIKVFVGLRLNIKVEQQSHPTLKERFGVDFVDFVGVELSMGFVDALKQE